jgi:TRAP-type uncharacterized transport system fused permease subunit
VAYAENGVYERTLAVTGQAWQFTWVDWLAGGLLIFAALDLSRRVSGWVIPILVITRWLHPVSGQLSARRVPRRQPAAQ